jgi:formate-dependent phosphoribosylglycinamide formyltransferase (GAR transformylase)
LKQCKKNNQQTEQVLKALNEIIRENKTKLKTEKIELGLVDDIEKIYGEVINNASKADKAKNNAIESIRKFKLETVKIKQDSAEGLKKLEEFKKAAKELGVDVPSKIQSLEKSFETSLKSMTEHKHNLKSRLKNKYQINK